MECSGSVIGRLDIASKRNVLWFNLVKEIGMDEK
jgi:hypothetical protein